MLWRINLLTYLLTICGLTSEPSVERNLGLIDLTCSLCQMIVSSTVKLNSFIIVADFRKERNVRLSRISMMNRSNLYKPTVLVLLAVLVVIGLRESSAFSPAAHRHRVVLHHSLPLSLQLDESQKQQLMHHVTC